MTTCTENPVSSFPIKASPTPAITNKNSWICIKVKIQKLGKGKEKKKLEK
jgi:hypothetical protein